MKTSSKPWYRKSRDAWYVQINGKQIRLAQGKGNRAAAKRAWLALMNGEPTEIVTGYRLATCFDEYLASLGLESRRSRKPVCDSFIKHVGKNKLVGELRRQDIVGFLKPSWSDSTTRTCIRTVDAAINRAVKLGKVTSNPFQGIDKPAWTRRKSVLSEAELAKLLAAARGPFKAILRGMIATGCRPGEICRLTVEACDLDRGTWTVQNKTEFQTGKEFRTIYLSDEIVELCRSLIGSRTSGYVFLNTRGKPYNSTSVRSRFIYLRATLGLSNGVTPYATRHRYATDAINKHGMDSLVVAKLMGHTNPMMLARNYYREDADAMRAAANRATGTQQISPALTAQAEVNSRIGAHEAQPEI